VKTALEVFSNTINNLRQTYRDTIDYLGLILLKKTIEIEAKEKIKLNNLKLIETNID
jgi:hypothetical protein